MQWDFWTLSPESAHQVDVADGRPRHPPRLAPHERLLQPHLQVDQRRRRDASGSKYHFKTDQGIEFLTQEEGRRDGRHRRRRPPARSVRARSSAASSRRWSLKVQIMPFEEAKDYRFNPFDLTKVWPHGDYPLIERRHADAWTATPPTTTPRSSRRRSSRTTWCPASGRARTRCCWPATSRMPTPTATGWGPTTSRSRSTRRRSRCTAIRKTARCGSRTSSDPVYAPNSYGGPQADSGPHRRIAVACRRRHGSRRLHAARRGRRLGPGRNHGARGARRRGAGPAGVQHRRPPARRASPSTCWNEPSSTGRTSTNSSARRSNPRFATAADQPADESPGSRIRAISAFIAARIVIAAESCPGLPPTSGTVRRSASPVEGQRRWQRPAVPLRSSSN